MPRIFLPPVTPANDALLKSDSQQQQEQEKRSTAFDFDDEDGDGEQCDALDQDSTTEGSDSSDDDERIQSSPDILHPKNVGVHPACQRTVPSSRKEEVVGASGSVGSGGGISKSPTGKNKNAASNRGKLKRGPQIIVANGNEKPRAEDGSCPSQRKRPRRDGDIELDLTSQRKGGEVPPYSNTSRTCARQEGIPATSAEADALASPAEGETNGNGYSDNLRIEEEPKHKRAEDSDCGAESGSFTVVFIAQKLGLTIAQDDAGNIIVCDREESNTHGNSSAGRGMVSIGDRVINVGGTSVAGMNISEVERMLVRGPRPLEVVFRRMPRVLKPQGARDRANKPAPTQQGEVLKAISTSEQPLGGLERPSRDCLLDAISNIATQEDSLAEAHLFNGMPWGSGVREAVEVGGTGAGAREKSTSSSGNRTSNRAVKGKGGNRPTPARDSRGTCQPPPKNSLTSAASPRQARNRVPDTTGAAPFSTVINGTSDAQARETRQPSKEIPATDAALPKQARNYVPDMMSVAPSVINDVSDTQARVTSQAPKANSTAGAAPPKQARNYVLGTLSVAPFSTVGSGASGAQGESRSGSPHWEMPEGLASTPPDIVRTSTNVGQAVSALRLVQPSAQGRGTESSRDVNGSGALGKKRPKSKKASGDSAPASNPPDRPRDNSVASSAGAGVGAPGSNKKVPVVIPNMDEVIRILAKLGSKGVSELTLYKSLTFDELVRVSRYAGVDLSKRLSKVAMAERLNSLYVEKGILRREQHIAATKQRRGGGEIPGPLTNDAARRQNMLEPSPRPAITSDAIGTPATYPQNVPYARPLPTLPPPAPSFSYPHEARVQSPRRHSTWNTTTASTVSGNERILTPQPRRATDWLMSASLRQGSPLNVARDGSGSHLGLDSRLAAQTSATPRRRGGGDKDEDSFWEDWDYHEHVAVDGGQKCEGKRNEASWWKGGSDGDWTPCQPPPSPPRWSTQERHDRGKGDGTNTSGWRNPLLPTVRSTPSPQIRGLLDETRLSVLPKWILRPVRTVGTQV